MSSGTCTLPSSFSCQQSLSPADTSRVIREQSIKHKHPVFTAHYTDNTGICLWLKVNNEYCFWTGNGPCNVVFACPEAIFIVESQSYKDVALRNQQSENVVNRPWTQHMKTVCNHCIRHKTAHTTGLRLQWLVKWNSRYADVEQQRQTDWHYTIINEYVLM